MRITKLFRNTRYIGQAKGERKTYYVFESDVGYLIAAPNSGRGFYVNVVEREAPEAISKVFKGKQVTNKRLKEKGRRPDLFGPSFVALNALYAMVALGRAKKLKRREGKAMVFKIR